MFSVLKAQTRTQKARQDQSYKYDYKFGPFVQGIHHVALRKAGEINLNPACDVTSTHLSSQCMQWGNCQTADFGKLGSSLTHWPPISMSEMCAAYEAFSFEAVGLQPANLGKSSNFPKCFMCLHLSLRIKSSMQTSYITLGGRLL